MAEVLVSTCQNLDVAVWVNKAQGSHRGGHGLGVNAAAVSTGNHRSDHIQVRQGRQIGQSQLLVGQRLNEHSVGDSSANSDSLGFVVDLDTGKARKANLRARGI